MSIESLIIPAGNGYDPVTAYFEDVEPSKGRLTLVCCGQAWTCFWGGMGDKTVKEFVNVCGSDYVTGKLISPLHYRLPKRMQNSEERYLARIVEALKTMLMGEQS